MDLHPDVEAALETARSGALRHSGPGRVDDLKISVPSESFIIPADAVSAIGQGNTENGFKILNGMFPPPPQQYADGGKVPIVAAGGEFICHPDHVRRVGGGDMKRGHRELTKFVEIIRAKNIKKLRSLPGPHK